MDIKKSAKATRDSMQQGIYVVINPVVKGMIKIGMTPNMVTTIGMLGQIAAAVLLIIAGYRAGHGQPYYPLMIWAGGVMIGFSVFDMLDGQVARIGNMASRFGAMYDSVLDRYCELFNLGGIIYFFLQAGNLGAGLVTFLALVGSLMVSYIRARAEGVGIECKIGFMQRPERVVVTVLGVLAAGILGVCGVSWAEAVLYGAMLLIAVFANLTAVARLMWSKKQLNK